MKFLSISSLSVLLLMTSLADTEAVYCGSPSKSGDFPYIVALGHSDYPQCGGAIINSNHIVTAAHCVDWIPEENLTVVAGAVEWDSPEAQRKEVEKIEIHPDYYPGIESPSLIVRCFLFLIQPIKRREEILEADNDIAVVRLSKPFIFGKTIKPVALPSPYSLPDLGIARFAAWGSVSLKKQRNRKLYWVRLAIVADSVCLGPDYPWKRESEFCTMDIDGDACALWGDSGSPLVVNGVLLGVASVSTCDPGGVVSFVTVWKFVGWIQDVMVGHKL